EAGHGPRREMTQHRLPVVGRAVAQPERDASLGRRARRPSPQRAGRAAEELAEGLVEAADAAEAGGQRHLAKRHARLVDELFGEEHAPRLRHRHRRGAQMLVEQAPELAPADAEPLGQRLDAGVGVERAVGHERQRARHRVRAAAPEGEVGRGLRPAAQAGPEPRLLRRRRRGEEAAIGEFGRAGGADRPAIDPGRGHADEKPAVETRVARGECAVTGLMVEYVHEPSMAFLTAAHSRFSDAIARTGVRAPKPLVQIALPPFARLASTPTVFSSIQAPALSLSWAAAITT